MQGADPIHKRLNAMWVGDEKALRSLGLTYRSQVDTDGLATVLRAREAVYDLTFWAPSSVSWTWAITDDVQLRADLERALAKAADGLLAYLARNRPVMSYEKPAAGFAAAVVLHARAWRVEGEKVPPPQLHAHCLLVGVTDGLGRLCPANDDALFEQTVIREVGAAGRAVFADRLRMLGFRIETGTGYQHRYFEIDGVPKGMLDPDAWRYAICCDPTGGETF